MSGYSHHLNDLLNNLLLDKKHQRQIDRVNIDSETFERVKLNFKKSLLNKSHDAAYQQLLYELGFIISSAAVHREEYLKCIDDIDLDYINSFMGGFFKEVAVRAYGFGNIKLKSLKSSVDFFFDQFKAEELSVEDVETFENKYIEIDDKAKNLFVFAGENNNNAEISLYKFSEWSIANQVKVEVLGKLLEQPFFTELRTNQQLGYVVAAFPSSSNGFTGLGTLIQSQTHNADDIYNRSRTFIKQHLTELHKAIAEEDVEAIKKSIINELSQKPNSMSERLSRFTMMAGQYHGDFKFFEKMISELNKLTCDTLKFFVGQVVADLKEEPQIVLFYRGTDDSGKGQLEDFSLVEDVAAFKRKAKKIQPYKK